MRTQVQSLALLIGLRIWHCQSYGAGCRHGSDPTVLWLWRRPAATAPTGPLAWELPYAADAALKRQKKKRDGVIFIFKSLICTVIKEITKIKNFMSTMQFL